MLFGRGFDSPHLHLIIPILLNIYQWTHIGYIPHVKLGRFVRLKERDVFEWLESKRVKGHCSRGISIKL